MSLNYLFLKKVIGLFKPVIIRGKLIMMLYGLYAIYRLLILLSHSIGTVTH